jgi:hypothetical protein
MRRRHSSLELGEALPAGLHYGEHFSSFFDGTLPAIEALDPREQVHTGHEPRIEERSRHPERILLAAERAQDDTCIARRQSLVIE